MHDASPRDGQSAASASACGERRAASSIPPALRGNAWAALSTQWAADEEGDGDSIDGGAAISENGLTLPHCSESVALTAPLTVMSASGHAVAVPQAAHEGAKRKRRRQKGRARKAAIQDESARRQRRAPRTS